MGKMRKAERALITDWCEESFQLQLTYLHRLQKMAFKDLKLLHRDTFKKLKPIFNPRIPPWMPRVVWVRRLFLYFAAKHYHFPHGHAEQRRFTRHAKDVLTHKFSGEMDSVDKQVKRELNKHSNFTIVRINAMPEESVDRYLIKLGYSWDKDVYLKDRRHLLWEYFNLPASETWSTRTNRDGKTRKLIKPRNIAMGPSGRILLKDLILENPEMDWHEFVDRYADCMPAVTHGSFRTCRWKLKQEGYHLPEHRRGRRKNG